ncbi:type VII secretion system-associated protein [Nocardia sp. NPDC002869]|uniref:type VII secretion system-associated protein n=1 Tax=Nocardia sp. NPDC002869 TaxID=3161032 RepID=UPI00398D017E
MDPSTAVRHGDWFVLLDPKWSSEAHAGDPPLEVVVGGWRIEKDGELGPFQPNPGYLPLSPRSPSDPIDALLRLADIGEDRSDRIVPTLLRTVVEIACDEQHRPRTAMSPDGIRCAVVVTAEIHKQHLGVRHWVPVLGSRLYGALPECTDILFNPGGDHSFRLTAAAVRPSDRI